MIQKARYYNNAQTVVTLMIDDFVPAAVTTDGVIKPSNDWGYGYDNENSLYNYLEETLLKKFPEIKGTFFIPLKSHHYIESNGYKILKKEYDVEFTEFAERVKDRFDFAFHGVRHTFVKEEDGHRKFIYEFNDITQVEIDNIKNELKSFESITGIKLTGGKFPGNRGNELAFNALSDLGFYWWTHRKLFSVKDIDKVKFITIGENEAVLDIPQTFTGDAFKKYFLWKGRKRQIIYKILKSAYSSFRNEKYLYSLYENKLPITIQEHFQNATSNGSRQTPNVFDDMDSLEKVYDLLRGGDLWYATANQLAHYVQSYNQIIINALDENTFELNYSGKLPEPKITLFADKKQIRKLDDNLILTGFLKDNSYTFNSVPPGRYSFH